MALHGTLIKLRLRLPIILRAKDNTLICKIEIIFDISPVPCMIVALLIKAVRQLRHQVPPFK